MNLGKPDCADCEWGGLPCLAHKPIRIHCPAGHTTDVIAATPAGTVLVVCPQCPKAVRS